MITKIKLNLKDGLVELEGSETFVENQIEKLQNLIGMFSLQRVKQNGADSEENSGSEDQVKGEMESNGISNFKKDELLVPDSFGEWMHRFKENIGDQEKGLVACFYVQSKSTTKDFKTSEVSNCLKEHGIKLANPSVSIQRLATKKITFQTRKVGKLIYMRVSKDGEAHLKTLFR